MSSFSGTPNQVQGRASGTFGATPQNPALSALRRQVNPAPGTPSIDPTQATATTVNTAAGDALQQKGIDQYNSTGDWAKQAGLNALSGAQRGASENAARMGLQAGGASYLAANSQGLVNGVNALNQSMSNWAQGGVQNYQNAANNAYGNAQTNAGFQQGVNTSNTGYARDQVAAKQASNAAADTAAVQASTTAAGNHKNWTGNSAATGAVNNATQAYYDAVKGGDPQQIAAAKAGLAQASNGGGYTSDGHSRTDPKLQDRIQGKAFTAKDGTKRWVDKKGNIIYTQAPGQPQSAYLGP